MDLTINLAVANRIWAIDSSIHRAQCGSNSEIEPWTLPSSASLMHSYQGRIQTGGGHRRHVPPPNPWPAEMVRSVGTQHEIAQNCVRNAQKSFAPPQTSLERSL